MTGCGATAIRNMPRRHEADDPAEGAADRRNRDRDQVQGRVVWQNENLDDLVLLRGDGNPTYMLAVVVDDHDMGVTHVIRGDDHLINAARQKQIYDALEWTIRACPHSADPRPDGSKLSKRHGALGSMLTAPWLSAGALRNY